MDLLEQVQRRAMKMLRGLEHLYYGEEAERVGAVQAEEGSAETLLQPFNIQRGLLRKVEKDFLARSVVTGQGT